MNKIKKELTKKTKPQPFLSTGSTLLNLAMTGKHSGGIKAGSYILLVGDSSTGKTWFSLTCFAEAMNSDEFKDYRLVFDCPEQGAKMDIERYFGKKVAERLETPSFVKGDFSETVEEFYFSIDEEIKKGKPFIYVLDSIDALTSEVDDEKFEAKKKAFAKSGNTSSVSGSFGTSKAKTNSDNIKRVLYGLQKTGSILIVINQTRDNLGFGFEKKIRSGGRALKFYADCEVWLSVKGKIKKKIKDKNYTIGMDVDCNVKKNRYTGGENKVTVPFTYQLGIDDIKSCIEYLSDNGVITKKPRGYEWEELELSAGSLDKMIELMERQELHKELSIACGKVWESITKELMLERTKRYK